MRPANNSLLADPAVQLVVAMIAAALLCWPIIEIPGDRGMIPFFVYVFVVWSGLILLLWRIGCAIRHQAPAAVGEESASERAAGGQP